MSAERDFELAKGFEPIGAAAKVLALQETAVWRTATEGWENSYWSAAFIIAWVEGWSDDRDLVGRIADLAEGMDA